MTAPLAWLVMVPVAVFEFWLFYRGAYGLMVREGPRFLPGWLVADLTGLPARGALNRTAVVQFIRDWVLGITFFLLVRRTAVGLASMLGLRAVTFARVATMAELISECAVIVSASKLRERHFHGPSSLRFAAMTVRGARSLRGTVPSFAWHRRSRLRSHASQVVTALRATQIQLDSDPKASARKLAGLLLKITSRYVDGAVGTLLDDEDLDSTARPREALRLALAAVALGAVALASQAFHLPLPVTVAAMVILMAAVYRSAVAAGMGVFAALYPLFFPH
ncbi:hypothetical protein GCM10010495_69640 [Kitasatospora herbaricolor]|uniref:hypothetical protein n=1 Tax=Kitasatospora herbaricolor TaxID=68217 RepID=UPI001748D07B|nr:hypothetical protein [Kitasatospora herbaricolor]MDQ0313321.1 hypothetical protein [Kitasatospora herbaricolor]GGV42057.1 hypothetical protein GCM10010495_69640 [Kitasatospora herbaricolor]